ncbi:MAG: thioredoxin family protein [Thermoplasmata archaeon]|nr:thioredoxin family protein [Thermoplasmata archaeon]
MKIEVFGMGCPKCNMLETNVKKVLNELGVKAEVVKITSIDEMVERGLMSTPALVIDGELVVAGRVPSVAELRGIVQAKGSVD